MEDIVPELLNKIKSQFNDGMSKSDIIEMTAKRIRDGTATHADSYKYARELGELLKQSFADNLSGYPYEKMYFNVADRILRDTLGTNYDLISKNTADIQTILNKTSGFNITGSASEINEDRLSGIIDKVSDAESFEEVKWMFDEPVVNFCESVVDDTIRSCADFMDKSGIDTYVIRTATGGCCEWCNNLAGSYRYSDVINTGNDVWKRHSSCHCQINIKTDKNGSLVKMRTSGHAFIG